MQFYRVSWVPYRVYRLYSCAREVWEEGPSGAPANPTGPSCPRSSGPALQHVYGTRVTGPESCAFGWGVVSAVKLSAPMQGSCAPSLDRK